MNRKYLLRGGALLGAVAIVGISTVNVKAVNVLPYNCSTTAGAAGAGTAINGDGSSFQNNGTLAAAAAYAVACPGSGAVTYGSGGSTHGINDLTARAVQYAGTDVPYTDAQLALLQAGSETNASKIETIPIAIGAVGVAFNNSCIPDGFEVTGTIVGQIYAGKVTDWSEIDPACPGAITSVFHRIGGSGTTAAFKGYLTKKDPLDFAAGCVNTVPTPPTVSCYKDQSAVWPNNAGVACGPANTNAQMASCVSTTAGSIAYVDLSDSASAGLHTFAVDNARGTLPDVLDLLLDEGGLIGNLSVVPVVGPTVVSTVSGVEDTIDGVLSIVDALGAGNPVDAGTTFGFMKPTPGQCTVAAEVHATPVSTSADWSQVDITDGPNGYGICTYTYQLAFNLPVHAGAATVSQAITISNFISYEVSDAGQAVFVAHNYDSLPAEVQGAAQVGAQELLTTN